MSIHLNCPVCEQRLNVSNATAGRVIQCVACGNAVRVPQPKALMATKDAGALPDRLRLGIGQIIPRSSEFVAQRPAAALGVLVVLIVGLIGLRFAKAAISDYVANVSPPPQATGPVDPDPWDDVGLIAENEHVRVTCKSATTQLIDVVRPSVGTKRKTSKVFFKVVLEIQNLNPKETIHYSGWGINPEHPDQAATIKDNAGVERQQPQWPDVILGQFTKDAIEPVSSLDEILVFELPLPSAKYLKLTLPAKAIGGTGALRIKIPRQAEAVRD
jgi:hypothetical protein